MLYASFLDRLSEGVVVLAEHGEVLYINPSANILSGVSLADLAGKIYHPGENISGSSNSNTTLEQSCQYILSSESTCIDWNGQKAHLHLIERKENRASLLDAIQSNTQYYKSIFDQQLIGFLIIAPDLRIVDANEKICRMLGYSRSEMLKKNWNELVNGFYPHGIKNTSTASQNDAIVIGNYEKRFLTRDGAVIHAAVSMANVQNPDLSTSFYTMLAEDISEQRRTAEKLMRQNQYLEALHETTLGLINHGNMGELLERIVRHADQLIGTSSGYLYTLDHDTNSMSVSIGFGLFSGFNGYKTRKGGGLAGRVWEAASVMTVDDYDTWEGRNPDLPMLGFHAGIALPLMADGNVVGVLGLSSPQSGNIFTEDEIDILKRFSQLASVVLNNAMNHDEAQRQLIITQQRENELQALASVSAALRTASNRTEIAEIILEQIMLLINSAGAALVLADLSSGNLVVEKAMGILDQEDGNIITPVDGFGSGVLETILPQDINDLQSMFTLGNNSASTSLDRNDSNAVVCIPLSVRNNPIGVIWIIRRNPFSEPEMRLLISIANITANAVNRTTLHEKTNQQLENLLALHRIDLAINTSHELFETTSVILDQVIEQLGVDAADILLFKPENKTLEYLYGKGFRSDKRNKEIGLSESLAGNAVKQKRIIHVPDMYKEAELVCAFCNRDEKFISYFAAPLLVGGDVKGVLEVFSRLPAPHSPLQMSLDEWMSFLNMLAGQTAIAVDNARLFSELENSNKELYEAYDATIEGWAFALELREHETAGHSRRVVETTLQLARRMGIEEEQLPHIRRGALLHDAGKMGIPDKILLKNGPLTELQWKTMREHPTLAYKMLSSIKFLQPALEIPYCHHEKWDGSGYPRQLKGSEIPLSARVFAVVDVWDALTSDRPYRKAWKRDKAVEYIKDQSGVHFDARITDEFLDMVKEGYLL